MKETSNEYIQVFLQNENKKPTNWLSQAKRCTTQLENLCRYSASLVGDLASNRDLIIISWSWLEPFSGNSTESQRRRHFLPFLRNNCRLEVPGDVISGVTLDFVGMDVCVKYGDCRLNVGWIITLYRLEPFYTLLCSIQLHFAADQNQRVTSYPASLWGLFSR